MIKKLVVLATVVLISITAIGTAYGQRIHSGDKSFTETRRTIKLIRKQIAEYEKDSSSVLHYREKRDFLENQLNKLIAASASKNDRQYMDLNSKDPRKVADAYLLVKYADNLKNNQSLSEQPVKPDSGQLKGIIVNNWYYEVIAQVTGPANFYREFDIRANGKSPEFSLPVQGEYTTTFIYGYERRTVSKKVGYNIIYYEGKTPYDYKATLLRE